jgi:amino acid adenylation domain-containing protein
VRFASIHGLLAAAAHEGGERIAVVDRDRTLTYAELERDSDRLAAALRDHGVKPGERVGLLLEKSAAAVVGIYGVLKAGAVYVPLDDQAPVRRLAYIARDAGIRCLISATRHAAAWERLGELGAPLELVIDADDGDAEVQGVTVLGWSALAAYPAGGAPPAADPDALAYVLYTSGSTGEPKGVMLSHANGLEFVDWAAREVGVRETDRLSSHAPLHFDLSTFDLFGAAWGGAPVVLVPRESSVFPVALAQFIARSEITVWYSVPSILTALVLRGQLQDNRLETLRAVIFAGEVFPTKYLLGLMELVPQARYLNFFGPTETNVCTWYEVPAGQPLGDGLPIGKPIPCVEAVVADPDGAPVPDGDTGELSITGPTVMHGYWGDPERTAHSLTVTAGRRTYRTGDLVRYRTDGNLLFVGRRDEQIKTRGYRVELGEIEAALNALDAVVECSVLAIPDEAITNRLMAFLVLGQAISQAEIVRACAERLPRYMIPDAFEFRQTLPRSSTGKVDRQQLQAAVGTGQKGQRGS